jgi:hypothetical protein
VCNLMWLNSSIRVHTDKSNIFLSGEHFFTVVPNIFGFAVWNLLRVTFVVPRILRWLLDF